MDGTVQLRSESLPFIRVQQVQAESSAMAIAAPARVDFRAQAVSTVGALLSGRVLKVTAQVGALVKAGEPLVVLGSGEAARVRADFARARAKLSQAEYDYRRQLEMQRLGVGLEVERVAAKTRLEEARAEFERTRELMRLVGDGSQAQVTVRAPMDGVVLKIYAAVGAAVEPGTPLIDLGKPEATWIVADVFENDLELVEKGAKVQIELANLPEPVAGHVVGESLQVLPDLRRALVFIEPDTALKLRPGTYARVTIEVAPRDRILLPASAVLIKDDKETLVYVEIAPGRFAARRVRIGAARAGKVEILAGLSPGERVVVEGALLIDGEAALLL
ncbi:hypothetical protein JCM13664_11320 [Methylothermus subterraneus]